MMMAAQEKRKEYCDILGVDEGASKEEIKKAYKKLAIRCHPDKNQLNPEATKEFQRISEAYTGLCQGDDYCEDDDDFDGGGFSVFELLQMFFVRSQLFIRPTWFSRFKEADDQSVDSENPCNSAQRNFWNCSAQPTRNEDWQMPGNTRSSSSAGRGNSGKNKDRRRNNRKNASSSHNLPKDPLPTFSKSGSSATGVNANDCPGDKDYTARDVDSVSEKPINEELTSESAAKNQSDGDKKKSKTGDVDSNCSGIGSKVNTEAANSDPYAERRGSDSSVNGSSQSCHDRKPSKKKLQAEQRKREKECAEIHKKVVEKNQKEEEKRKKKEEKEKAKLAAQSIACENPQTARAAERINSNLSVPGLEESSLDQRVNEDVETDAVHDQEEEFLDPETFNSNDRIADGSECNPESIETLSTEGITDGGKGSSEFLKDLGSEKDLNYKEDHGRRIHTEHTTYSRTFYSNSANRNYSKGRNRNAIRNSDNMSSKNVTEKFKTENTRSEPDGFSLRDQYSSNSFRNEQDGVSCGPPGTNPSGSQINDQVCTDNAFKSRGRPSFARRGHVYRPGVPNPHSEVGLDSADPAFVEKTAPTVGNRQNYQYHRNANTFGGNRGSRGGGGAGQIEGKQRYNQYDGESRNEVGDSGFDIVGNPPNTSDRYVSNKEHSKYAGPEAGDRCGNFPKEPFHSEAARPYMGQNPPDQFRKYRGGQGRNRGFGRGRISQNDTFMRNTGRRPYDQEFGKKDYEFHNKTASIAHGGGDGDAFNGKTMEFHRSKAAFGDKNHAAANLYASVPPHKQQSSKEFVTSESKVGEPVQCTFGGASPDAPPKNVWQDRKEFYEGALPKSREEEDEMLEAALKLSRFDASEELREPTAEISSVDHLPPSQISQDDDQVADTPPFHTERLHSWADEMEEVVNRGGMDFNVSSSMSFQSTQGSESLQSCDLLSSERMTRENIQPLPVVVPFGLKSSCIYPATVVSSDALDTPQKTAAFVDDVGDCVRSNSLVPDVLKSDESCRISENLGNIRICETPEADKFSFKTDENNFDRLQDKATATKTEHSILDDVDEYGRGGVVRDQSLPELNADDLVNPQPLESHNKYLEIGENVGDSAENNCDTADNDPANPCPNFAPPAGYYPPVMGVYPPFYPPYHGSFPFYPCPSFWPYMFPGLPMMPTASPQPISCPPHSHSADQCLNEVPPSVPSDLPIVDLHQQGHLSQPPLFPSMFPALPLGYNPHGPQMAAFAPPHMPPFITMHIPHPHCHTAHGETIDSFPENQPVKSSADEEM